MLNSINSIKNISIKRNYKEKYNCNSGILYYNISQKDINKKIINNQKFQYPNYSLSNHFNDFLDYTQNKIEFKTLELPYLNNQKNISCIPVGNYILVKHNSPKFKQCFKIYEINEEKYKTLQKEIDSSFHFKLKKEINNFKNFKEFCIFKSFDKKFTEEYGSILQDPKGRSHILIHAGNTTKDTTGCILVGLSSQKNGNIDGGKSKIALEIMLETLDEINYLIIE